MYRELLDPLLVVLHLVRKKRFLLTYSFALLHWWCLLAACLFSFVHDAYIKITLTKTKQTKNYMQDA